MSMTIPHAFRFLSRVLPVLMLGALAAAMTEARAQDSKPSANSEDSARQAVARARSVVS